MGRNRTGRMRLMSGAALSVLALGNSAFAEEPASDRKETLLDLIVVGSGVPKVAIDTPQAVTVLDQEALDDLQPATIGDVFRDVPGVTAIGSDRIAGQSFNIRGIGELGSADESKIIVTVDGATKFYEQYRVGSFFSDPELYKQVEILRGPASSTLYGSGAIGGVINFTTKDASDFLKDDETVAVRLKGMYDSNKYGFMTSAIVAGKINEATEVLLNGNFRKSNDYVVGGGEEVPGSAFSSFSGLVKGIHRFGQNDEQTVRLSYQRWQSDANDTEYSQTGTLGFGTIDRDIVDQTVVFSYENPASDNPLLDLSLNLSFSDTQVTQTDSNRGSTSIFADSEYGYRTYQARVDNTFEHFGNGYENYLTVGTQLSYQQRLAETTNGALGFHPEGTDTKAGFFIQDEFIWNEKLSLIPGARIDFIKLQPNGSIADASDQFETAFSPKLAALYKINDYLNVFGSVAHTQRAPTLDEMFSSSGATGSYPGGRSPSGSLDKETSNAVEAGFSVSAWDLALDNDVIQLKATGFYNDLSNLISTNPNQGQTNSVPYYVNVDKAEIYGLELEAAYNSDYVFGNLAYSLIRGEDKDTGKTLNSIPADTLAMTLGGRLPDHGIEFGWRGLFAAGIETGATTGPFGGYGVHDLFGSWKPSEGHFKGLELRASVENIFDKRYQNNLAGDEARGRTFKLTLNKQFSM